MGVDQAQEEEVKMEKAKIEAMLTGQNLGSQVEGQIS